MSSTTLLLLFAAICSTLVLASSRKMNNDRAALINSAITQVKQEYSAIQEAKISKAQGKLHAFKKATPEAKAQGLASLKFERMVKLAEEKILKHQRQATAQTTSSMAEALATELLHKPGSVLSQEEIARIYQESGCPATLPTPTNCDGPAARFHRLPDGSCNNRENPTLGAAGTALRRLIDAQYDDGISRPVGFLQSQGSPLVPGGVFSVPHPSARVVSLGIVEDRQVNDSVHTHILMQWGQFMDHDMDAVPEHDDCENGCEISDEYEGRCYPFAVPEDDPDVMVTRNDPNSLKCHAFRRSVGVCSSGTELAPREQLNGITHWVDGSNVYGHSRRILNDELRDRTSDAGLLRTGPPAPGSSRPLLPAAASDSFVACPPGVEGCFTAGDFRVNEQSALTVMHTLWLREHNRIAQIIKDSNPSFTSNKVFLTTREIVAAEIQKITYYDFLPILLGDNFDDFIPPYNTIGYDPTIDPSIPNAFATAAYRFGHSQIQPFFDRLDENYESVPEGPLSLLDSFFDTSHVRQSGTDPILRGLLAKPARKVDEFLNSILTSRLFARDANTPGLDLAALNIQRGRDHGLPRYLTWKQWAERVCKVESGFRNQLTQIHLLQTYGSLDNVDLFVGGLAEEPLPGGLVGAVFACIFSQTFVALRNGDRFFYENFNNDTALFSAEQREQLGRASLSRVICDNTDITEIQANAFLANQRRVPCSQIPSVDLSLWNEVEPVLEDICYVRVRSSIRGGYFSVSRRVQASGFRFHNQIMTRGSEACFPVLCPAQGGQTIFVVASKRNICAARRNRNLPQSQTRLRHVYLLTTDSGPFVQDDNGLYTNLASCQSGSAVGVSYNCGEQSMSVGTQQDPGSDIDTDSEEEIRQLVGDDDLTNELIGGSNEKLVNLMEKVIKELQASSHQESVSHQDKEIKTPESDTSLTSELEMLLKELE